MSWKMEGSYFESCNCEAACPCVFLSKPTDGQCGVLVAWHIDKGKFEDVPLDGLNVALAVRSPGHMMQVKWDAALYLDERANPKQKEALTKVFGGQAGGHPARLASHVGKILGVASVPMKFASQGKLRSLSIPSIAEVSIEGLEGQGGAEITVTNHPLCIAPGNPAVTARSRKLSYKDHGMSWELSGKSGFFSPFQYAS
jgi:hypothetical protein